MNIKILKHKLNKTIHFLEIGIWQIEVKSLKGMRALWIRILRVSLLTINGFTKDKISERASALTFFSMLSVVPVIAMGFGIAKGFGFDKDLENKLRLALVGQETVADQIIIYAKSMLEDTKGGMVAGIGLLILFWSIMKLLNNIETSLNDIWQIKKHRTFDRKFADYTSLMLFAPILVIVSSGLNVFITTQIKNITESIELLSLFSPFIMFMLKFIPYSLLWLLFTSLYLIMPNTKVQFSAGFIAGVLAGTTFQLTQWGYITFQLGVSKYNAIYGSLAALPLFMIWLQLSWLIILAGAEISYGIQNASNFEFKDKADRLSNASKRLLALLTTHHIITNFKNGKKPVNVDTLTEVLHIPRHFILVVLNDLLKCKIINEVQNDNNNSNGYQPALGIENITLQYVIKKMDMLGVNVKRKFKTNQYSEELTQRLDSFDEIVKQSAGNQLLCNLQLPAIEPVAELTKEN